MTPKESVHYSTTQAFGVSGIGLGAQASRLHASTLFSDDRSFLQRYAAAESYGFSLSYGWLALKMIVALPLRYFARWIMANSFQ